MDKHDSRLSRADEKLYAHHESMEEALSRAMPMAKNQASAVLRVVGGWRPRRMVDIGAGTGAMLQLLSHHGFAQEYAATDISELSVSFINDHPFPGLVGAIKATADHLPYENQSFDLATLSHVLEHVPDPVIALEEASRVASKVCVEVPLELALLPTAKAVWLNLAVGRVRSINRIGHIHFFSVRGVRDLVRSAGLQIEREYRYGMSAEWLRMYYGKDSMNCRIRETLHWLLPVGFYGFLLQTHFTVLCSRP